MSTCLVLAANYKMLIRLGGGARACADVVQTFHRMSKYEKKDKFINFLNEDGRNAKERTLVFVKTTRQPDFLCLNLCEEVYLLYTFFENCWWLKQFLLTFDNFESVDVFPCS